MDKLTADLTIKLTPEMRAQVVGVADAEGLSASEYVRGIIWMDLEAKRAKYRALATVFAEESISDKGIPGGRA